MKAMTMLSKEEVAVSVGVSTQTLYNWYRFKKNNPDSEYSKMLPDYIVAGNKYQRLWNKDDINKLIRFKNAIPKGRNGVMGDVTQMYVRKTKVD